MLEKLLLFLVSRQVANGFLADDFESMYCLSGQGMWSSCGHCFEISMKDIISGLSCESFFCALLQSLKIVGKVKIFTIFCANFCSK